MTLLLLGLLAGCGPTHAAGGSGGRIPRERSGGEHQDHATKTVAPEASSRTSDDKPPPYIAKVVWVSLPTGRSLQIYPTANGRVTTADGAGAEAWREVVRKASDAATKGMRAQFDCHWAFARLAEPDKPSWNLEPWRPVVSAQRMYDTRCNPGGPEV